MAPIGSIRMGDLNHIEVDQYKEQRFERLCGDVLSRHYRCGGYTTPQSNDGGVDVILETEKGTYYVQCKSGLVKNIKIESLHYLCDVARKNKAKPIFISRMGFTDSFRRKAKENKVELMDFADLCRIGHKVEKDLYFFGDDPEPVRMGDPKGMVRLLFTYRGLTNCKAKWEVSVDGTDRYRFSAKNGLSLTTFAGKHSVELFMNGKSVDRSISNLKEDVALVVSSGLTGKVDCDIVSLDSL